MNKQALNKPKKKRSPKQTTTHTNNQQEKPTLIKPKQSNT